MPGRRQTACRARETSQEGAANRATGQRLGQEIRSEERAESLAGCATLRLPARGADHMSSILGEWREDKVRPLQGNAPRHRPVSRGISCSLWSICDDLFPATRFPQLSIPGARYAFLRHGGIYRSDVARPKTKPGAGT